MRQNQARFQYPSGLLSFQYRNSGSAQVVGRHPWNARLQGVLQLTQDRIGEIRVKPIHDHGHEQRDYHGLDQKE